MTGERCKWCGATERTERGVCLSPKSRVQYALNEAGYRVAVPASDQLLADLRQAGL